MTESIDEAANTPPNLRQTARRRPVRPSTQDRIPPHSPEGEQGILGCVLLSPNECIGQYIEKFGAIIDPFYDLRHQTVMGACLEMYDKREAIDVITLQQHLKDQKMLEQVGGLAYLSTLPDTVPSAANLSYYIDIVREKYLLRRMVSVCSGAASMVYEFEGDADLLVDQVEADILKIRNQMMENGDRPIKELVMEVLNDIEKEHQNQGRLGGIETGFGELDRITNGLQGGEMIVIAARPSMGKTSLALNIVEHVGADLKLPCGVFSLEMTDKSLVRRLLLGRARVNIRRVRDGQLEEGDFPKLTNAAGKIQSAPIYIDERSGLSIMKLRAKARRWHKQYGIKLLVIDYLQLLNNLGTKRRFENRQQEITEISSGIKALAKELKIPIIVLSQLNRELERDKNRKPRCSDLRESGAIEQDADLIGFLYRPGSKEDQEENNGSDGIPVNLLIEKQRNGPAHVDINLTFLKSITRFESCAKINDEDIPQ